VTYVIKPVVPISDRVACRVQELQIAGETPSHILFSPEGYSKARLEAEALLRFGGVGEYAVGTAPMEYMGIPYSIGRLPPNTDDPDFVVDTKEAEARRRPPPPTDLQLANRFLEMLMSGLDDWLPYAERELSRDKAMATTVAEIRIGDRNYRVTVETLEREPI
jgi:hypothetical protein